MNENTDTMVSNKDSELAAVIGALLDTLDDKNADVRSSVTDSVHAMCKQYPQVTINSAVYFWELHKKISVDHLKALLNIVSYTFKDQTVHLNPELASAVTGLAITHLSKDTVKEAAEVLVALSKTHPTEVLSRLLSKLEPNEFPDSTVIHTLGLVASENAAGVVEFLKLILNILLPISDQPLDDIVKQSFCFVFGVLAEIIGDCIREGFYNTQITKKTYEEELCSVYDILSANWLRLSRHYALVESVLTALVPLLPLLPVLSTQDRIVRLTPTLLYQCKKPNVRLAAARVLRVLLENVNHVDTEVFRPLAEQIHQTLFEFVAACPFEANRDVVLTHFEVLQCYRELVILYTEEELDRILQHLKSQTATNRARSLVLLKHLVNTLPAQANESVEKIAFAVQESISENGCTRQTVAVIVALAARPAFSLTDSQKYLFATYLISNCVAGNKDCAEALHLLATTVEETELWLWPVLINALLDQGFQCVVHVPILQALSSLATRVNYRAFENNNNENSLTYSPTKILCRCLELMGNSDNRHAVLVFLKWTASIYGHNLQSCWDEKLSELLQYPANETTTASPNHETWEEKMVEILEDSVKLEGEEWGSKLATELALKAKDPHVALFLGAVCNKESHIALLVELSHGNGLNEKFAKAVGICSKHHLDAVLKFINDSCLMEDSRKPPVKLLGLMKDAKGAAIAEAAKAGLLSCYGEIAKQGDVTKLFPFFEKDILPWIIRQLSESKELTTKEAGLFALEQIANAVYSNNHDDPLDLRIKSRALAVLLNLLQSPSGYRPLTLYPAVLRTMLSLIHVSPTLNVEERRVLLSTVLEKVIAASSEIVLILQQDDLHHVIYKLGIICSEVISDSADGLAEFIKILSPWIQSKSSTERKATFTVLRTVLRSYYNSLKFTYPSGKLEPGRLIGQIFPCCADSEHALRPLVVDCVMSALNIAMKHRSILQCDLEEDFSESKQTIVNEDPKIFYNSIKSLAHSVSEKIPSGEIVSYADGLIEALLYQGETGVAAGIALSQHFSTRSSEMFRADIYLINSIVSQMKHMDNLSCRRVTAGAVKSLMSSHPEEVIEHLLSQPLPLDRGTEECWAQIATAEDLGSHALQVLLMKLENNNFFINNSSVSQDDLNHTALFPSVAAMMALKCFIQSVNSSLIEKHLSPLLSVLFKYLAGWLCAEAPISFDPVCNNNKFGFTPNRQGCKINLYAQAYSVLACVLNTINLGNSSHDEWIPANGELRTEEQLILTIRQTLLCISSKNDVLPSLGKSLGKLFTSNISAQRAVAAAFYAELVGNVDCGAIWLDAILNMLHEAKADSSVTVRKLATLGLARIAYLEPKQMDEYFDNCMAALLAGLEESVNGEGGIDVILESLRGLSGLLAAQSERPISPRIILALKPFIEKDDCEMKLAGIQALTALAGNWRKTIKSPEDEVADNILGFLPSLTITLEDSNCAIVEAAKEALRVSAELLQCESLKNVLHTHFIAADTFHFEDYVRDLILCLQKNLPQRAEELRNAAVRGYSRSENSGTRSAATVILGLSTPAEPEQIQRLLQLLHDTESIVRARAARALAYCYQK